MSNEIKLEPDIWLLRKMAGVTIDEVPEDPEVLARRPRHIAAAACSAKWQGRVVPISTLIWFVLVALPLMSKNWRLVISAVPILDKIFYDYATFSGLAIIQSFIVGVVVWILFRDTKNTPSGNYIKDFTIRTSRTIISLELYPRTKQEEKAFWRIIILPPFSGLVYTLYYSAMSLALLSFMKMQHGG